jgi:hypothetical protein
MNPWDRAHDEIQGGKAMPDESAAAGNEVVEMLGACAAAPDDLETGRAADEALMRLEQVLAANLTEAGAGAGSALSQKGSS